MKKFKLFRAFFLLLAVLSVLSGCAGKKTVEQSGNAYTIYYLNTSGIQLVGSEYRTETTDLDALVRELLDKMGNVPADLDCQRALPERIEKITYRIEGAKYRLFNRIGQQPIFSVLICGASGIGKTEVARLLHQKLAADEPMIKINFGNYSAQDALNSLIGSPRGYIGSNKGELPDKLMRSRSKVILIDEFEKASKAVYNFFLQLLEEGKFTDSLGREYDLEKYIIIFTSNMPKERIGEFLPPELRSRFSYKCAFWPLSTQEKEQYVAFKSEHYLEKIKHECPGLDSTLQASDIIDIDVSRYSNMRDINSEIMRQITDALYAQIVK